MILEGTKGLEDDEEEKLSEYEDHISINSESDSDFEEEDEIDHQPASKDPISSHTINQPVDSGDKEQATRKIYNVFGAKMDRKTPCTCIMSKRTVNKTLTVKLCPLPLMCCIGWHEQALCSMGLMCCVGQYGSCICSTGLM